ncbi:unnamed protein product [Paramecium sonneborni]|uniref:CRAL-TRIO domain-containing protein n=1 Tax=Paramecium sonneborni TaxID=65129 RepID=A0A8S1LYY3_9CILI|nr:unnamed protein product [Paramecium sonneborni]
MIDYMKKEKLIEPGSDKVIIAGKIERKIFENIQMEPIEQEQLNNLKRALINIPPLRLPKEWQDSDYLRILSYCDYEITNTIQVLKQHLLWRNNINLSNPPNFVVLNGAIYIHWHDKGFRPVIIIDINKALQYKLKEFKNGFDYLFNMLIRDILISYYVESTIILIDLGNLNQQIHLITNELMEFVKNCEINYYGRIHKIYILEDVYKFLFNRVVQVLKPSSQDKIVFLQKKNLNQLTNQIDENQLELKFSGLQPNIQSNFWPPKDLPNVKIKKFDKKDEVKSNMSNTDENLSKSQLILQKNRPESSQNSQLFLQVYNEEQEVIISESHIIEFADSFNNLEYYPDSQFQSSKNNCQKFQDTAPLQSTTIKPRDLQRLESENWSSSDLQMSSKFITQNQKQNPCCQSSSTCQLI